MRGHNICIGSEIKELSLNYPQYFLLSGALLLGDLIGPFFHYEAGIMSEIRISQITDNNDLTRHSLYYLSFGKFPPELDDSLPVELPLVLFSPIMSLTAGYGTGNSNSTNNAK